MRRKVWWIAIGLLVALGPLGTALAIRARPQAIEFLGEKTYGGHSDAKHIAAIGDDLLVAYGPQQTMQAYGLDGKLRWEFVPPHPPGMLTGVAIKGDRLYVGTNCNFLYAVDKAGKLVWQRPIKLQQGWGLTPTMYQDSLLVFTPQYGAYEVGLDGTVHGFKDVDQLQRAGIMNPSEPTNKAEFEFQNITMVAENMAFTSSSGIDYSLVPGEEGLTVKDTSGNLMGTFYGGNGLSAFTEDRNGWVWHLSCGLGPDPVRWKKYLPFLKPRPAPAHGLGVSRLILFDPKGRHRGSVEVDTLSFHPPIAMADGSIILPQPSTRLLCYRVRDQFRSD